MNRRILIVEADPDTTNLLKDCLELLGCVVETETDGKRAVARLTERDYSGIILDIILPGISGFEVLRQLCQGGSTIPVIAISGDAVEKEVIREGAQAFLAKPFPVREFKRVVQRFIPPTSEELIQDHSGGESTIQQKSFALAKAGDFIGAREAIELLDDAGSQHMGYIRLLTCQVRVGDLAGAKETVHAAPVLWTGGHWVRCLLGPLVKSGDLPGALDIVARLTDATQRGFHKRVIVALQATAGSLSGAKDTSEKISPEEGHRDAALCIIAEALVRRGDFRSAIETASSMGEIPKRAEAIGTIIAAQAKAQGAEAAEQALAAIADESLKKQARAAMEETNSYNCEPIDLLSVWRITLYVNETFDTLYPDN